MKKLSVLGMLILVAMFSFTAKADIITLDGANEIANAFFANSASSQKRALKSAAQLEYAWDSNSLTQKGSSMMKSVDEDPTFYVFNNPDGEGFVIVSGDDNARSVIGYSYEGNIPAADEIPAPMQDYLLGIDEEIKWARTNLTSSNKNLKSAEVPNGGNIVKYIETATWGQRAPFNAKCFTSTGAQAKTGCVPTAFAIVMHKHKWPLTGPSNVTTQYNGTFDFSSHTYDWDNMAMSYPEAANTSTESLATLMSDLGISMNATYGSGSTGVTISSNMVKAFTGYFQYTGCNTMSQKEIGFSDATWKSAIIASIEAGCPIPYSATNPNPKPEEPDGIHMFVLDGYTDNNYYHFNWGWYGVGNGWFELTTMNPDESSIYTQSHRAFFNLSPNKTVTVSVDVDGAGSVTIDSESVSTKEVVQGTQVTLQASSDNFFGWVVDGVVVSIENPYTFTATENKTYTAKFATEDDYVTVYHQYYQEDNEDIRNNCWVTGFDSDPGYENPASYPSGVKLTLTANSNRGYKFDGWYTVDWNTSENILLSTQNSYNFEVTGNEYGHMLVYSFSQLTPVTFTVTTADANMGSASMKINGTAVTEVYAGEQVTLVAEPVTGYVFKNWKLNDAEIVGGSSITVTADNNQNYVAYFVATSELATITVNINKGGTVSINGGTASSQVKLTDVQVGSNITLQANPVSPNEFLYWVDYSNDKIILSESNPWELQVTGTFRYKAIMGEPLIVTATTNNTGGSATVYPSKVLSGKTTTLTATPAQGYTFTGWSIEGSGDIVSTDNTYEATITANTTYVANFASGEGPVTPPTPTKYTASVVVNPSNGGIATVAVGTGAASSSVEVEAGTEVTFYAQAAQGYEFVNWTNGTNEYAENPFVAPINANLQLTANFVADEPSTPEEVTYPTMTVSGYGDSNFNRYLAKVTASTATQNVTVFEVTSESADDFTNPTTTVLIDKTATPIKVTKGERALSMTFITWLNNVSGKASQMNWVQQAVYIDWNNDGNFTDSEIYEKSSDALGGTLDGGAGDPISTSFKETSGYTRMITIPANQEVGTYRMRVVYHEPAARGTNNWHKTLFGTGNGAISKGRAYDFSLEIVEGGSTPIEPSDPKTLSAISVFSKGENSSTHYRIPALVELENGTLVAIADKRGSAINDLPNTISIVAKTSTNKGETWSDMVTVAQGNASEGTSFGDAAAVYDAEAKKIVAVFVGFKNYGTNAGVSLWSSTSSKLMRLYQSESIDGKTWTTPKDITEQVYSGVYQSGKLGTTRYGLFTGSGSAVQLKQGTNKGRLMFVVAAREDGSTDGSGEMSNFAVYSDNHGESWNVSSIACGNGDEAKVVELSDGKLLMSIKNRSKGYRLMAKSNDQGVTWESFTPTTKVLDPACNGDVVSTTYGDKYYLLHSIPANSTTRRDVSIYISEDDGTNWTLAKQVFNSYSAYSSLEVLNDGTVGIIVEEGKWDSGISGEDVFNLKYYSYTMDQLLPETPEEPETPVEDKALELDGTRYMSIPNDAAFSIAGGGSYTITFKVKIPQYKSGANMRFVSNRAYEGTANSGTTGFDIYGGNSSSQAVSVNLSYDGKPWSNSFAWNTGLTENTWAHISWVLDGTTTYLYVDGVLKETKTGMSTLGMPSKANILVGAGYTNTDGSAVQPSFFTTGSIDNVRFYNKALSASEISADMTSTVNSSTANLVAAYDFNNVQGLSVEDISGNGHTGTLVGFPEPDVQYIASVNAGNGGIANVDGSSSVTVNSGNQVTYTATANDGYRFTGWSNGTTTVSTDNPYTFAVTSNIELTANFRDGVQITSVIASTNFGTYSEGNTVYSIDNIKDNSLTTKFWSNAEQAVDRYVMLDLGSYYNISDIELYFDSGDQPAAATVEISIDNSSWTPVSSFVKNDIKLIEQNIGLYSCNASNAIARYVRMRITTPTSGSWFQMHEFKVYGKPAYAISANATEGGTATVSATVVGAGESVTFTATPSTGYNFAGWYNGENKESEDAEYTVTNITSDIELTAKFEKQTFTVTVTAGAGGSVNSITNPVEYGTSLELTATPAEGYKFKNWSDDSTENPYTVTVTDNISLVANFVAIPTYTVNVSVNGNGSVEKSAGSVLEGNTVTLTATPAEGYKFTGWYQGEELISKSNPYTVTVTGAIEYVAKFEESSDKLLLSFACLSDLHAQQDFISDANNIRLRESATKTLEAIKEQENVDLIVLGGDYTSNTYIPKESWEKTRQLLIEETRKAFNGTKTPVIYVNGNHEYEVAYPNIANSDGTPKQYNAGEYYGTPMKTDIGALATDDCFYETAINGTGEAFELLAAYHYVVNGFDFVVLNAGQDFFTSASDYSYSIESVNWCATKLEQIYASDPTKTVFFLVHIPFSDSKGISNVNKGMNKGVDAEFVTKLKTTLAKYPNLIMLYGHDHGTDSAYIRSATDERVTEYATDGSVYTGEGSANSLYYIQNFNTGDYLGFNAWNLATTDSPTETTITLVENTTDKFYVNLSNETTTDTDGYPINYLYCGTSGRFSGNNSPKPQGVETGTNIMLFEVSNPASTTITATQVTSITAGKTYLFVGLKDGNYYALSDEMYKFQESKSQRMVGAAVTITDGTITYTPGTASVLWTINKKPSATDKSFISSFMGSMRYYNNTIEKVNGSDDQLHERNIVQALMVYVYSDRVELKMKNYAKSGTINGITVNENLDSYVSERTVTHSEEAVTATPTITPQGGVVNPGSITVTVNAPEWHNVYYTINGDNPTEESATAKNGQITFTANEEGDYTVKVAAQEGIRQMSPVASVTYTVMNTHGITVSTNGEGGTASFTIEDTNVILTASEAAEGYEFVGWSEGESADIVSTNNPYTTAIVENAAYKANYAKLTFNVTVTASPVEGGTVNTITNPVEYGTTLELNASVNSGYKFVNWTLNGTEVSTSATFTTEAITADAQYVANFAEVTPEQLYEEMLKPRVTIGNVMEVTKVDIENAVRGAVIGEISLENVATQSRQISGVTYTRYVGATDPITIWPGAEFDLEFTLNTGTWFGMQFYQMHNSTQNIVASYGYYGSHVSASETQFWTEVSADERIVANETNKTITFHIDLSDDVKAGDIVVFRALSVKNSGEEASISPSATYSEGAYLDILFVITEPVERTVTIRSNDRDLGYPEIVQPTPSTIGQSSITTSDPVTVRANIQHDAYCRFENWTINGVEVGTDPDSYTYEGVADATITANFVETCMVSVSSSDVNMGTATMSVSTSVVDKNTEVTFIAEAAEGYKFVRWTNKNGELVSNDSEYTVTVESHTQLIAEFAQKTTYNVVVTGGTANGSANSEIEKGTEVTFTAIVPDGQEFVNWTDAEGNIVSTDETFTIKVVGEINITANFREVQGGGGEVEEVLPSTSYCVGTAPNNGDGNHYAINKIVAKVNGTEAFTWNSNGSNVEDVSSTCAIEIKAGDVITFVMSSITGENGLHSSWAQAVIYFDWNQNGDWTDSGESTILFNDPGVAQVDKEYTITVPNTFAWNGDINAFKFRLNSGEAPKYNSYGNATPCQALKRGILATFKAKKPATTTVTPSRTISAIANFADGSAGTVTVNGSNSGSATAEGTITLVATPASNSQFVNWTLNGTEVATNATITDNSEGSKLYVANFKKTLNRSSWGIYTVSSEYAGLDGNYYVDGGKAIDGNNNTYWHTDWNSASNKKVPQWIVFNLGSVETFDSFNYLSRESRENANGNIAGYKLYVSTEAPNLNNLTGTMEEVKSGTFSYPGQEHKIELGKAVRGQYVMLYATSTNGEGGANMFANCAEFYLYASDDYMTQVDLTKVSGTNATVKVTTDAPATITVGTSTYTTTAGNLTAEISTQSNNINIVAFGGNITNVDLGANVAPVSFPETVTEIALRNISPNEVVVDAPALEKITVVSDADNKVAKVSTTSDLSQGVQVVVEKEINTPQPVEGKGTPTIYNFLSMPFAFNTSSIKYLNGNSWEAAELEDEIRILMYNSSKRANGIYSSTWEILKADKDIAANQGFVVIGNNDLGETVKLQFTSAEKAYNGSVESVVAKPYRHDSEKTSENDADWNFNGVPYLTSGVISGYTLYFHTGYAYNSVVPAIAAETSISAYQGVMYQAEVTNNISKYIPVETASVARNTNASEDVFARAYISVDDTNPAKIILSDESSENFVVNEDAWYLAPTANTEAAAYFNVGGAEASVSVQPAASELPMTVYTGAGTQHRITLTATDGNYDVYLKDAVTNEVVCLNDEDYNFTAAAKTTIANRFTVSMVEPTGIIDAARAEGTIKAVVTANGIKLFGTEEGDQISLYNANGMIITNATAEDGVTTIATSATGVIIIKVADQTVKVVK
ncbi:MAG: C10 family peptidase [Muribaculaceae bacterium]|nr:C10 family peptidase [Muribaculaceae bacterium]